MPVGAIRIGVAVSSGGMPSAQAAMRTEAVSATKVTRSSGKVRAANARLRLATTSLMLGMGARAVKTSHAERERAP